jgi:hypothetical protein
MSCCMSSHLTAAAAAATCGPANMQLYIQKQHLKVTHTPCSSGWHTPVLWQAQVHLLNDERGPVIETLVARTLRQVRTCTYAWARIDLLILYPEF